MKLKIAFIAIAVLQLLQGCSYRIATVRYNQDITLGKNDLFYHLPKTNLIVAIVYKIVETTKVVNGIAEIPTVEYHVKGVDVKTFTSNDPAQLFVAKGINAANKFFLKENIDFKFNDKGIIQSVATNFDDESLESVESLFKGVAAVVGTIALAGKGQDSYLKDLDEKISMAYRGLLKAINKSNNNDIVKYKTQIQNYFDLLDSYNDKNKEVAKESEKIYTFFIDPDKIAAANNKKEIKIQPVNTMPEVTLAIEMNSADNKAKILATGKSENNVVSMPGLIYTIPASLRTTISVATTAEAMQNIFEHNIDFAQYGNLGFVPVTSKIFASRKTKLEFNPTTGVLTTYMTESGSSSENLGKTIENSATLLKSTLTEIKYDNKIDALKKQQTLNDLEESLKNKPISQTDSLKNALDILKLQIGIRKLKIEIDSLSK